MTPPSRSLIVDPVVLGRRRCRRSRRGCAAGRRGRPGRCWAGSPARTARPRRWRRGFGAGRRDDRRRRGRGRGMRRHAAARFGPNGAASPAPSAAMIAVRAARPGGPDGPDGPSGAGTCLAGYGRVPARQRKAMRLAPAHANLTSPAAARLRGGVVADRPRAGRRRCTTAQRRGRGPAAAPRRGSAGVRTAERFGEGTDQGGIEPYGGSLGRWPCSRHPGAAAGRAAAGALDLPPAGDVVRRQVLPRSSVARQ